MNIWDKGKLSELFNASRQLEIRDTQGAKFTVFIRLSDRRVLAHMFSRRELYRIDSANELISY